MSNLVLSLFPGMDVLGMGFEAEGFCVVHARDFIFGGDVRTFHPPAGKFDGIIGGDPCQSHSALVNLVRAKGLTPKFPDLTPAFAAVIEQARPAWFLRENVPRAPDIKPEGYEVTNFLLDNCWLGEAQMRKRRFWFGVACSACEPGLGAAMAAGALDPDDVRHVSAPNLWKWIETATFELPDSPLTQAVSADSPAVPLRLGGSGKVKVTAVGGHDGTADAIGGYRKARDRARTKQRAVKANEDGTLYGKQWTQGKVPPGNGRHDGAVGSKKTSDGETIIVDYSPPRRTLAEMLELQGLPPDFLDEAPYTMQAKRKLVGNAVPLPMAKAIAKAVKEALR